MTTTLHASHQLELSSLRRSWVEESKTAVIIYAAAHGAFSSDDLHPLLPEPAEPKWFGILFAALKNSGHIERIGYAQSTRPERNGGVVATWRLKK